MVKKIKIDILKKWWNYLIQRNYLLIPLSTFVFLLFFYIILNWTFASFIHSRKDVIVPDLRGKSLNDALNVLSNLNLGLRKESDEFNQNIPLGTIIRQNPMPGITVREGKIIKVTISQGGQVSFVPNLIGLPIRTAEINIRSAGLNLGEESTRYSILYEKGIVVDQDPKPGSIIERDSLINLVISSGKPPDDILLMPKFINKDIDEVRKWGSDNQIDIEIKQETSSIEPSGTVIRQDIPPDTEITRGQKVVVWVADYSDDKTETGKRFYYEIPQGSGDRLVKLTMVDDNGEKEIFNGTKSPGTKIDIPINPEGKAKIRIFINNILVEERDLP